MKINKYKTAVLFSFFLTSLNGFAKIYTGRVTDQKGTPVEFANVMLLSKADSTFISGGMTDKNGHFSIDEMGFSKPLLLKVSSVGYTSLYKDDVQENMGTLQLTNDTQLLKGITVKGELPQTLLKGNALVTNIQGTVLEKIGTANDVLSHIPGLTKLGDGYTVLGKGEPLIYINGRKMRNKNELDRLSSEDIKHVELITNPGAEYDASANAVVKITTNRKAGDGFGFNYRQVLNQGYQFNHNEMLDMNYRKSGLDVFASLFYGQYNVGQKQRNDNFTQDAGPLHTKESLFIINHSDYVEGSAGFNYDFNDKQAIGATYTGSKATRNNGGWNDYMEVWRAGKLTDNLHNISDFQYHKVPTHTLNTYYSGTFGKVNLEWNGDLYFSKDGRDQKADEISEHASDSRTINTSTSSDSKLYATKLVATCPLWKGSFQAGSEYTNTTRTNSYTIVGNATNLPDNTSNKIKESNIAGFITYNVAIHKVQLNGGLRFEHVTSDYYEKGQYVPEQSRNYNNLFPSFSVNFPIDKVQFSLSYSVKTLRPSYVALSSEVQYNSRFSYQSGNPLLRPTDIHDITGLLSWKWIQLTASWRYKKNMFYQSIPSYNDNPEIVLYTFSNLPHSQQTRIALDLSPKFGLWEPQLSLTYLKQYFHITDRGYERKYNSPIGIFTFNNAFQLPAGWIFRVDMEYITAGNSTGASYWRPSKYVNVSLYKSFFHDRLSFNLQGNDLFAGNIRQIRNLYGSRNFFVWNYSYSREVRLTIRYKFNPAKSKYKGTGAGDTEKSRL